MKPNDDNGKLLTSKRPFRARAYDAYFLSVSDYNRAQFRLYRALGYPADIVASQPTGPIMSVDTSRPPQMAPVCAPVH